MNRVWRRKEKEKRKEKLESLDEINELISNFNMESKNGARKQEEGVLRKSKLEPRKKKPIESLCLHR